MPLAQVSEHRGKVQDLMTQVDGEGQPMIEHFTFLKWFLSEELLRDGEDPLAEELRSAIWPNPMHFYMGGVRCALLV